jgi:hypothetical protein
VRGVRGHELAEAGHDRGDEQAAAGDREPYMDERRAHAAGQDGGAERRQHTGDEQRPAPARERDEQMGGGQLEPFRVEPQDRDAEIGGDAAGDARSDPPQPLEERAFAQRQLQAERRVAPDQRAVARREGAVHRATEHGRVRDRGDERHDERAHDERVGHGAARHAGDDLIGDDAPDVPVVQRGGQSRRELLVVDERVIRVPRRRRHGEEDRGQDDHRERGRPSHASDPRAYDPSRCALRGAGGSWIGARGAWTWHALAARRMLVSWLPRSTSWTATSSGS